MTVVNFKASDREVRDLFIEALEIICNVSDGDWSFQKSEWRDSAHEWIVKFNKYLNLDKCSRCGRVASGYLVIGDLKFCHPDFGGGCHSGMSVNEYLALDVQSRPAFAWVGE